MTTDPLRTNPITFKVALTGIRKDMPIENFRHEFAALFKTTPASIDRLLAHLPYVLKKNIGIDQAIRYQTAIENTGGICHIEENSSHVADQTRESPPPLADIRPKAPADTAAQTPIAPLNSPEIYPHHPAPKNPEAKIFQKFVAGFRRFLLLDIPERSIALNFKLPSPSARAKVGSTSSVDLYNAVNDPPEFFKLLHARIKFLNFAHLSMGSRLRANRHLIKIFYSPATKQLVELAKTGGVPEPEGSRQLLIWISDIASILIISYAIVFASY